VNVRRLEDPAAFLEAASPLLLADEARHNLILGIAGTLRDHPAHYPEYGLWLAEDGGETVGAALRTPPHNLVVARPREDSVLEALAEAIDDDPPAWSRRSRRRKRSRRPGRRKRVRRRVRTALRASSRSTASSRWLRSPGGCATR
jgi:hypothetical protein